MNIFQNLLTIHHPSLHRLSALIFLSVVSATSTATTYEYAGGKLVENKSNLGIVNDSHKDITYYDNLANEDSLITKNIQKPELSIWAQSYKLETALNYKGAASIIMDSINVPSTAEMANSRLGWLNYLQGKYAISIDNYKKAIEINPNSIDANLGITLPFMAQKRYRSAVKYTLQALELSPNNYTASAKLMYIYTIQQKWKSLNYFSSELSTYYPNLVEPLVYMARSNIQLVKIEAAKSNYRKVLRLMPGHIEAISFLGDDAEFNEKDVVIEPTKPKEKTSNLFNWFK